MEHGWVNASLLWCDFSCRALGAKTAVPSHLGTSLAGPALQGSPGVLGSAWRPERARGPPAAAGRKASSKPLHSRAKCCHHSKGVLAPSHGRVLHAQTWIRAPTHLPMSSHTQDKCSAVAKAGHSAVLSPLVALQDAGRQTQEKN